MTKHGDAVRAKILEIGMKLWASGQAPTARAIASDLGVSAHSAVIYHFGSAEKLRNAIAARAVETENNRVIVQLIATKHKAVSKLTEAEKKRYLRSL